jgi:hypothetical protein
MVIGEERKPQKYVYHAKGGNRGPGHYAIVFALEQALAQAVAKEVAALAQRPPSAGPVSWPRCFRGIDTLSAMILEAETAKTGNTHARGRW